MSAIVAFYTVAIVCAVSLIGGFFMWKLRFVIWRGYFRAFIICEDKDRIVKLMRLKKSDTEFYATVKGKRDRYDILDERVYRSGRFRVPESYYIAHRGEPIDILAMKIDSKVSATRQAELAKNTVTSGLLNAFTKNPMREAMAYMMAVGIVLAGLLILGYYIDSRISQVVELLGGKN